MARRRAIIVALLIDLEVRLIDAALDIADRLIGGMFRRATTMQQRRYTASSLEFGSACGSAAGVKAIELLCGLNTSGKREVPADAPMPFRKEWRRLVVGTDGRINRRL